MPNTVLARTPSYDLAAAVARGALRRRPTERPGPVLVYPAPDPVGHVVDGVWGEDQCLRWAVTLNISAARRWLACDPPRWDEAEASLRGVAAACAHSHPDVAADLESQARELARAGNVEDLLDSLGALVQAERSQGRAG